MTIKVISPTGATVEFPEGTDEATISNAMRQLLPADPKQPAPSQSTPQQAPASTADVNPVADVAKSTGIGLAQGAIGFATLPGNLESLGRLGIDKAAEGLGYKSPELSGHTVLPTASDAQGFIEKYTGPFYKPQTTAGEYARTIGEFAPLAAFGGPGIGAAARAGNVVIPALTSETAGQLTKGTSAEPWARAAGGLFGPALPNAAMRSVTPLTNDAARAAQIATLEQNGVTALTAGQRTGNSAVRWAESAANDLPFSGGRGKVLNDQAAEQFTRAALSRAGIQADRATADVIDAGFTHLGNQFQTLGARNNMRVDRMLDSTLNQTVQAYERATAPSLRAPIVGELRNDIMNAPNGTLTGRQYNSWRSAIERTRRSAQMSDPHLADALSDIRDALDDAMARNSSRADAAAWRDAREHYRNLITIEKASAGAGENTALGLLSPSQLRTAAKTQNTRAYVRGQNDLGNLARAGEAIMKPLPNSGTPARLATQHIATTLGAAAGGSIASIPGAILGSLAPGMTARTIMSAPVQRYLSNQRLEPAIESYNRSRLPNLFNLPLAAAEAERPPSLIGGIGPRYDENGNLIQ